MRTSLSPAEGRTSTFVQKLPEGDPVPGHGHVLHFGLGFQQSNAAQVVLLYPEGRGVCGEDRQTDKRKDTQTGGQTSERQKKGKKERRKDRQKLILLLTRQSRVNRLRDRQTEEQTRRQAGRQAVRQTVRGLTSGLLSSSSRVGEGSSRQLQVGG